MTQRRYAGIWIAAAWMLVWPGLGQAQNMEERLRTQLRSTTQQLQQVQSERAQLEAAKRTAEAERDAADKALVAARAEIESLRARSARLEDGHQEAQAQVASSRAQIAKAQSAYETLHAQATAVQSEASTLKATLAERDDQYRQCLAKNEEMYQAGRELLTAYEAFGTGDLLSVRQPFSGRARVLFDEQAQAYGDRLYRSQVKAGESPSPAQ